MSGVISGAIAGYALGGGALAIAGGALAGGMLMGGLGGQKQPNINIGSAGPAPQASKSPSASSVAAGMMGTGQGGGAPGVAQTMLTGAGGIDPTKLALGKNTLLGQ